MKDRIQAKTKWFLISLLLLALAGCTGVPEGTEPVQDFKLDRYLGSWYEIARMDHKFERGLSNVTAEYQLKGDGTVRVLNRGFNTAKRQWKEAEGKAKFVDGPSVGMLKVSFFGPFYASYNVIALDQEAYQWSLVTGPDKDYLWILSRTPVLDASIRNELITKAKSLGYKTDELIFVEQEQKEEQKG